jgi:hypothetical protein
MSPAAFSANMVKCTTNDWQLDDKWLSSVFPALSKVAGSAYGAEVKVEFLRAELQKDPLTALQTIMNAYLKLVKDAKQNRKAGDPWPVIIIDEANALMKWKDKESLEQLLAFFVYLTKQEQLAHVILATSDTFLTQWLDKGALHVCAVSLCFQGSVCFRRPHQTPFPLLVCAGQPVARGGAHVLLRLRAAQLPAPARRKRGVGARVRGVRWQPRRAGDLRL